MSKLADFARLRTLWDSVVTSLWFVPALMMLCGIALALAGLFVDSRLGTGDVAKMPWWVYVARADDARELVAALLTSTLTMTSLVFSITIVVLTLAASQFGPRLIRNFMGSSLTQGSLGTFTMTALYCLLVLASIGRRSSNEALPYASISLAVVLMTLSVALLVLFIHALARSIVSETVIDRVGHELDELLLRLEPVCQGRSRTENGLPADVDAQSARFGPAAAGYVQAIEFGRLVEFARAADVVVRLHFRVGDHVVKGGQGIAVHPHWRARPALVADIKRAIAIGIDRTPVQDPEFAIRHLVEIAVRALSTGINDPYTAVAVIHRLTDALAGLMGRALPDAVFRDEEDSVRVVCPRLSYGGLLSEAFDQIRQNGADKPLIVMQLLRAIGLIAEHATGAEQLEALRLQHGKVLEDARRAIAASADRDGIEKCGNEISDALDRAAATAASDCRGR